MLTYFKNEIASICEDETVAAVINSFIVATVVLVRTRLMRSIFLSMLFHVLHVIVMMFAYDGLVALEYIIQSVSSLQAHEDGSSLSRSLSSTLHVTLTNLEYFR